MLKEEIHWICAFLYPVARKSWSLVNRYYQTHITKALVYNDIRQLMVKRLIELIRYHANTSDKRGAQEISPEQTANELLTNIEQCENTITGSFLLWTLTGDTHWIPDDIDIYIRRIPNEEERNYEYCILPVISRHYHLPYLTANVVQIPPNYIYRAQPWMEEHAAFFSEMQTRILYHSEQEVEENNLNDETKDEEENEDKDENKDADEMSEIRMQDEDEDKNGDENEDRMVIHIQNVIHMENNGNNQTECYDENSEKASDMAKRYAEKYQLKKRMRAALPRYIVEFNSVKDYIDKTCDMRFLHNCYERNTLYVKHWESIIYRNSSFATFRGVWAGHFGHGDCVQHFFHRLKTRMEKYEQRQFCFLWESNELQSYYQNHIETCKGVKGTETNDVLESDDFDSEDELWQLREKCRNEKYVIFIIFFLLASYYSPPLQKK